MIGHSRKAFVGKLIGDTSADRSAGNIGISLALAGKRIQILRIHDVQGTRDARALFLRLRLMVVPAGSDHQALDV